MMKAAARDELTRSMSEFLREEEAADRFSGTVVIEHGEEVVFEAACGMAHQGFGVPNHLDTRFNLASIAKMFTAVAVLQLWERGKISLDDTIDRYLPGLQVGGIEKITIAQLLCHTSGLGDFWNEKCKQRRSSLRSIQAYLELIEGQAPAFEPGSMAQYSNSGYLILGGIIESVGDADFYDSHRGRPYPVM